MPQEYHVVKCFKCELFQVEIVKKTKKWFCKVCGEKQSLIQEFGRGASKSCREVVQNLNNRMNQATSYKQEFFVKNGVKNNLNNGVFKNNKWSHFVMDLNKSNFVEQNCSDNVLCSDYNNFEINSSKEMGVENLSLQNKGIQNENLIFNTNVNCVTKNPREKINTITSIVQSENIPLNCQDVVNKHLRKRSTFNSSFSISLNKELRSLNHNNEDNTIKKSKWGDFVD